MRLRLLLIATLSCRVRSFLTCGTPALASYRCYSQKCEDGPAPLPNAAAKPESVVRDISALLELNELLIGQPSENYPYKTTKRLTVQVIH
eukprot:16143-Heterococcus_DN1.PRE.1